MASQRQSLQSLESNQSSGTLGLSGEHEQSELEKIQSSKDAQRLSDWVRAEYEKAKQARTTKQMQWFQNLSMFYGKQYAEHRRTVAADGFQEKLVTPKSPYYRRRKTINRTRSFVRTELSRFLSSEPHANAVPSTAEDEDLRAAFAAEQAWQSISETNELRKHYSRAAWWMILTGVGFIKTWWDNEHVVDRQQGIVGDICYGHVTPFHLFVPDLREIEMEDQPFVINAYTKPVAWAKRQFQQELSGIDLAATTVSANTILEEGVLDLSVGNRAPDSVIIYECWAKPGAHELLPEGGLIILVDTHVVALHREGLPYDHGMYPFTKFDHIPTSTFYSDSPLVDTNQLQREFNQIRTEISEAGARMAKPQLVAAKGSIVASKITNEPGLVIEYRPGAPRPEPLQLSPLPQYYVEQQDRILTDWEDITGQHEVSKGSAPPGVTAGTAISFLQEKDNQYLTPQYLSIEEGYGTIAKQTLGLFVQYVDLPRKMKVVGADGAYDTVLLSGSSISSGTDVRIQPGSSVGESQAAKQARVMDMFAAGVIQDPNLALKMLEIGGVDKVLDLMSVAERKAQRENIKLKTIPQDQLMMAQMKHQMAMEQYQQEMAAYQQTLPADGLTAPEMDPMAVGMMPQEPQMELLVPVAEYDVHEAHVETHNKFRMSQEFEALDPVIQMQFELHVAEHQRYIMEAQMRSQFMGELGNGPAQGDMPGAEPGGHPQHAPEGGMDPAAMGGDPMGGTMPMPGAGGPPMPEGMM